MSRVLSKERVASFLVPILIATALLYQALAGLQIAVFYRPTLLIIAITLATALLAGLLAAFGPTFVRVTVLAACTLLFIDVTFKLPRVFDRWNPVTRSRVRRDEKRVADLHRIKAALEDYAARAGGLPAPADYGEAMGPASFWSDWWDVSGRDDDRDGVPFLDFLVESGVMSSVPVDPSNVTSASDDPREGRQYVFFVVPPKSDFEGGTCDPRPELWHYMLAITDLEEETNRPPRKVTGSGCECLWKEKPNYFQSHFDYVLCGSFTASRESQARALQFRVPTQKQVAELRTYKLQDNRRVADIQNIQKAMQTYLNNVGPLPAPRDYGESEKSDKPLFWQGYWDVSSEDGDKDGKPFLDFLVESGTVDSVPVDPDNVRGDDGDPRGGRQYVYYLVPPAIQYEGGTCAAAKNQWVYLLGITDLRSEPARPPRKIASPGCECLWRDQPDFFKNHFDYVVCGTFTAPAKSGAAAARPPMQTAALSEKQVAELRTYEPQDNRRVADILNIQKAMQRYLKDVGPLPAPRDYGESEKSDKPLFWQGYWDVSSEDGDKDGKPFLDFLVESGTMDSVPVDPENVRGDDGDPRGGRQYVYYLVSPAIQYEGGTCAAAKNQWVYLLGITDLRSEPTRPPRKLASPGCKCLWRDQPDFFKNHFDFVTCGTFRR